MFCNFLLCMKQLCTLGAGVTEIGIVDPICMCYEHTFNVKLRITFLTLVDIPIFIGRPLGMSNWVLSCRGGSNTSVILVTSTMYGFCMPFKFSICVCYVTTLLTCFPFKGGISISEFGSSLMALDSRGTNMCLK